MPKSPRGPFSTVAGMIGVDGFGLFIAVVVCAAIVLGALLAGSYLRREELNGPEFFALLLLAGAGGVIMAMADDFIVLFLGLETLSLAVYVLAAMHLRRAQSQEAGIKYFVLGAFSSAFLLYGIALVYGATGSTNFIHIRNFFGASTTATGVTPGNVPDARRPAAGRPGAGAGGPGLQGGGGAVPLVEPRRLRRLAHPGGGLHGRRGQGRRLRRLRPGLRAHLPQLRQRLAAHPVGAGRAVAGAGSGAGHRADQRQAHAGLLVDQPRRVHPAGGLGGQRGGQLGRAVLRGRLHLHGGRILRGGGPGGRQGRRADHPGGLPGPVPLQSAAGRLAHRVPAVDGRHPVHRRVLRQVPGHRLGAGQPHLLAGHRGHAVERHRRLPVPAHRGLHVPGPRRRGPGRGPHPRAGRAPSWPSVCAWRSPSGWGSCPSCSTGPPITASRTWSSPRRPRLRRWASRPWPARRRVRSKIS